MNINLFFFNAPYSICTFLNNLIIDILNLTIKYLLVSMNVSQNMITNIDMLYLENKNNFILSYIVFSIRDSVAFL